MTMSGSPLYEVVHGACRRPITRSAAFRIPSSRGRDTALQTRVAGRGGWTGGVRTRPRAGAGGEELSHVGLRLADIDTGSEPPSDSQ